MKTVKVDLGDRSYDIIIKSGILSASGRTLRELGVANAAYIITNPAIRSLYGNILQKSLKRAGIDCRICIVPDSEKSKSHQQWYKTVVDLADFDKGRGTCVIALGGGVVGDLAGFVAATYRRGVPFIQIPTTLLAQVDSAIGGKVAIDIESAKNIVGAFYQPKAVLSDLRALKSLPPRQIRNGLSEIIKYGIILDKNLFSYLENNVLKVLALNDRALEYIIARCSQLKAEVVSADEYESSGYRSILNFGHTIGHAIEAAASFGKSISHGEAIAVGMACAFDIAVLLGMTRNETAQRAEALIRSYGLPVKVKGIKLSNVIQATSYDKKIVQGKKRWVLPVNIGHVVVTSNIPQDIVIQAASQRILP